MGSSSGFCRLRQAIFRRLTGYRAPALIAVLVLLASTYAMQAAASDQGHALTVSAKQEQVSVYPVIRAKKHHSLAELTAADVSVSDNGHRIDKEFLRFSTETAHDPRPVTFLFDQLDPVHARSAVQVAKKVLKAVPGQTDAIAVWAITNQLQIVRSYTQDRSQVSTAIDFITDRAASHLEALTALEAPAPPGQLIRAVPAESLRMARELVAAQRVPWGMATLEATATALQRIHGRKVILYFTEQAPSGMYATEAETRLSRKLRDANVSLFVFDMNSIDADAQDRENASMAMGAVSTAARQNGGGQPERMLGQAQQSRMGSTISSIELGDMDGNRPSLRQVALDTAGGYSYAGENMKRLIRSMNQDLTSYCEITYPAQGGKHADFHSVTVKAHGGTWKGGYLAQSAAGGLDDASPPEQVEMAAADTMERLTRGSVEDSLGLREAMLRMRASPQGLHQIAAVEVPMRELEAREDGNTKLFSIDASVAVEIRDAQGRPVMRAQQEFRRHAALESEERVRSEYLSFARPVVLSPGEYSLLAVLRDWNSGKTGRVTQKFTAPGQRGEERLSDLLLVRSLQSEGTVAGLPYGQQEVVPNLSSVTDAAAGKIMLYFQQYSTSAAAVRRKLSLEVTKNGKLLATMPLKAESPPPNSASAQIATVTLRGPGVYDLALSLEQDGDTVRRHLSLTLGANGTQTAPVAAEEVADMNFAATPPRQTVAGQMLDHEWKPDASPKLSADRSQALIEAARANALAYTEQLPNFVCLETLDRSEGRADTGEWRRRDTILERLRYQDKTEKRTLLEANGEVSHRPIESMEGTRSNGEFGSILKAIFDPASHAQFHWKGSEDADGSLLQVFAYSVDLEHSSFTVSIPGDAQVRTAFDGFVYVDNDTQAVRRLVAVARGLPLSFSVQSSWIALRYDYIAIHGHEYLMPASGEVGLERRKQRVALNELHFSNYRRFGSEFHIVGAGVASSRP